MGSEHMEPIEALQKDYESTLSFIEKIGVREQLFLIFAGTNIEYSNS